MKKLLLILTFCVNLCYAQLYTFTITDGTEPLIGATLLLKQNGKSIAGATDQNGKADIKLTENTIYKLRVTAVGYNTIKEDITTDKNHFTFTLKPSLLQLKEVAVKARKPLITQEDDKTIVDPEVLIQSSTNLMEVLEKTPGLFADSDGNIYLSSSTPAKIYINGREQRMGSSDLTGLLRSLPPNSVEKIEIIRTPSASLDASNSGGSVNIILRKGYNLLGSGSVSIGMNQGDYGNQFLNASYNKTIGKTSYFINGGLSNRKSFNFTSTHRTLLSALQILSTNSRVLSKEQSAVLGYGLSHELNKKWTIDYEGRVLGRNSNSQNITTTSSYIREIKTFDNNNTINNDGKNFYINQTLNAIHKIDTIDSKIVFNFSADFIKPKTNQNYNNLLEIPQSTPLPNGSGDGINKTSSNIYTAMVDLTYKLKHKTTLESGIKLSILDFKSNANYNRKDLNANGPDFDRTNAFNFHNRIAAAYIQGSKTFGSFSLKLGTRLENTYMNGNQIIPSDTTFKIQRTDIFPFVYLSQKIGKIAGWDMRTFAIARRTISRPGYSQLNPFRRYIDEFSYESGNPGLRPQFANNYEINISVDETPIVAFGQNFVHDIFTSVIYQDAENAQVTYRTFDNLTKNKETYFRLTGAIPPGGKYFFYLGIQYNLNDYSGFYEGQNVNFRRGSWQFYTYHEFKIDKKSTLTMNGFYQTKGQQQFLELSDFGSLGFNLNRRFLKNKLVLSLNTTDILFTNKFNFRLNQGNILANGNRYNDSRRYGINLRYNFGNKKKTRNPFSLDVPTGETGL